MPPNASEEDEPRIYIVRLSEPAEAEIEAAYLHLMGATSFSFADRWQDGLFQVTNGLSLFPLRHEAVQGSDKSQSSARRLVYRQGRVVYRVLFDLVDEDDDGEMETVVILHVRHGAQLDSPSEDEAV